MRLFRRRRKKALAMTDTFPVDLPSAEGYDFNSHEGIAAYVADVVEAACRAQPEDVRQRFSTWIEAGNKPRWEWSKPRDGKRLLTVFVADVPVADIPFHATNQAVISTPGYL